MACMHSKVKLFIWLNRIWNIVESIKIRFSKLYFTSKKYRSKTPVDKALYKSDCIILPHPVFNFRHDDPSIFAIVPKQLNEFYNRITQFVFKFGI